MTATPSNMLPLGTRAPDFTLPDVTDGYIKSLAELAGEKATVVMFICNHCPYVKHIITQLVVITEKYIPKGIAFIAISSNDVTEYPEDSPVNMNRFSEIHHFSFPYLYDETQETARAYLAACTPDIFVFDKELKCVYRGQFDDSRPGNTIPVTGVDLTSALDNILHNLPVNAEQKPGIGCSIKWKN